MGNFIEDSFDERCAEAIDEFNYTYRRNREMPKRLMDLADMPEKDMAVTNNTRDVSSGKVFWGRAGLMTICCKEHGAMNSVSKNRAIWRCLECNVGAYIPKFIPAWDEKTYLQHIEDEYNDEATVLTK